MPLAISFEPQVLSILDRIKSLNEEKEIVLRRVLEVRSLITTQIDSLMSSMQDAKDALDKPVLIDKRGAKMHGYLFFGMISILETLKKA